MNDELSPKARHIVDAARDGDQPTDADRNRVRAAVFAAIGAGAATAASATASAAETTAANTAANTASTASTASTAGSGVTAKLLVATLVTAAAAGGGYLALSGNSPPPRAEVPAGADPIPLPAPTPAPIAPSTAGTPAEAAADTHEPEMEFAPDRVSPPAKTTREPSTIQDERSLLSQARSQRRGGDPTAALALLDEYSRRFSGGKLLEERAALRVLVLCDLGDSGRAKRQATAFRSRWPNSVQAKRVNGSCAGSGVE